MTTGFSQVQTRHMGIAIAMANKLKQRQAKGLAFDQLESKLQKLVDNSSQETQSKRIDTSKVTLPDDLPISRCANDIVSLLKQNQVVIIAGETGCGKTTQLPKLCALAGLGGRGLIAHTQPRRVAATSVAKRIAEEMSSPLGELVGYSIRFNRLAGDSTRVMLMTDGVLLSEIESDPLLSRYETIIIDEAHERSLNIDFLLGFLKELLPKRPDLKLIITSATIDPEKFSRNFNDAPMVLIEGRSFPVEVRYRPLIEQEDIGSGDPILDGVQLAVDECVADSMGDILIFADGEGQIKSIIRHLQNLKLPNVELLPLYARLSVKEQQRIFAQSSRRKIIVSTNVAETSLTVPGIIFVIDIGNARISRFSQRSKIQQLPVEKISQASAEQRKGRCGRVAPGICIRLYDEADFQQREAFTPPEIQRTNLAQVALKLKALKVSKVERFPFMEAPSERAWKVAFNSLFELGAIDEAQKITSIGLLMAKLPVDPQLARIIVQPGLQAVNEMLIICSLMSVKDVRLRPHDKQQKADQSHTAYHTGNSDVLTAIKLWHSLQEERHKTSSNNFKLWCGKHLINFLGWLEWRRVYQQLREVVESLGIKVNQSASHDDQIHSALIPGFLTHILQQTQQAHYQGVRGLNVWIHPSSLSFKHKAKWLISLEMMETEKLYARMNGPIKPEWVEVFAKHLLKSQYQEPHWRKGSGQVMVYLSQTLLGLPIVNRRLVNFANVDPDKARAIFLKEGLAQDQIKADFPFLSANRNKMTELLELEQRQRQNNICIDVDSLAEKYAEILPQNIGSLKALRNWLKKDFKARNQLLSFSRSALTTQQSAQMEDYPSSIMVKGVELQLSYCFAPGTTQDGISVAIPKPMIKQFNDQDFEWLVPGYLEEKVLSAIKSLPKARRKILFPLSDTAQQATVQMLTFDSTKTLFSHALATVLQRLSGQPFTPEEFDLTNTPGHLTMKFELLGDKVSQTTTLQSLKMLKAKAPELRQPEVKNNKVINCWLFERFEIVKTETRQGIMMREFQGLKDRGASVVVMQFPDEAQALNSHLQGVARLLLEANKALVNKIFNGWPDKRLLEKLSIRFDGFRALFDNLSLSLARQLVVKEMAEQLVYREADFDRLNQLFNQQYNRQISALLSDILPLLNQREKLLSQIGELNLKAVGESVKDMRAQLMKLWQQTQILTIGDQLINDYGRYHKALAARLKRVRENFPKEQLALETWQEWSQWWLELSQCELKESHPVELNKLFWQMEEFRISLFSPGVKVKGSISGKKLQHSFETLENLVGS